MSEPFFDPAACLASAVDADKAKRAADLAARKAKALEVKAKFEPLYNAVAAALAAKRPLLNPEHFVRDGRLVPASAKHNHNGSFYHDLDPVVKIEVPDLYDGQKKGIEIGYEIKKNLWYVLVPHAERERFDHWVAAFERGMQLLAPFIVRFEA